MFWDSSDQVKKLRKDIATPNRLILNPGVVFLDLDPDSSVVVLPPQRTQLQ
jgi:hypothetical protein